MIKTVLLDSIECKNTDDLKMDEIYFVSNGNVTDTIRRINAGEVYDNFTRDERMITESNEEEIVVSVFEQHFLKDKPFKDIEKGLVKKATSLILKVIENKTGFNFENVIQKVKEVLPEFPIEKIRELFDGLLEDKLLMTFTINLSQDTHREEVKGDGYEYIFEFGIVEKTE